MGRKPVLKDLNRLIKYIDNHTLEHGYAPSYREMAKNFNVSLSTIFERVKKLKEAGLITMGDGVNRSISIAKEKRGGVIRIPKVGRIACGQPLTAIENIEEFITLSESLVGTGDFFILTAYGDSMIEAGIEEGDYVIIRQQNTAEPGDIVVALLDDEATLKRFYPEPDKNRIRLHPENSTMQDIYVDDINIQGVAVKVIKDTQ